MAGGRLSRPLGTCFDGVRDDWREITEPFRASPQGRALIQFIDARVGEGAVVYPPQPLRALELTPRAKVRAVIVGQDPYHGPGQAEGLAFSVPRGVRPPPSLRNIFKELQRDLAMQAPPSGDLSGWAEQGVLLLNACLTVEDGRPASHAKRGWEALTDALLAAVAASGLPTAFLLWGSAAQAKADAIDLPSPAGGTQRVWRCNHPSPLSATRGPAPFIGCGHFSDSARFLAAAGRPVDWGCLTSSAYAHARDS